MRNEKLCMFRETMDNGKGSCGDAESQDLYGKTGNKKKKKKMNHTETCAHTHTNLAHFKQLCCFLTQHRTSQVFQLTIHKLTA